MNNIFISILVPLTLLAGWLMFYAWCQKKEHEHLMKRKNELDEFEKEIS